MFLLNTGRLLHGHFTQLIILQQIAAERKQNSRRIQFIGARELFLGM